MANIIDPNDALRIQRNEDDEKKKSSSTRTDAPAVSPSKQGQFLAALERKDSQPKKGGGEGKKEVPAGLFQAIQPKEDIGSEEEGFAGQTSEQPPEPTPQRPIELPKTPAATSSLFEEAARHVAPTQTRLTGKAEAPKPKTEKEKTTVKKEEAAPKGQQPVQPPIVGVADLRRATTSIEEPKDTRTHLQALVKECVSAIETLVSKGETTSVVTLKNLPLFEGSTLTVTEYATARKEFNISFTNLSPDARRLIEVAANQDQLRQSLVEKGYALHMITIEAPPKPIVAASVETQAETGGRRGEGQKKSGSQGGTDVL